MNSKLRELAQNLQKQLGLHRELLENLRREHQALLNAEMREIQEITYAKEIVLATLGQVERDRVAIMEKLVDGRLIKELPQSVTQVVLAVQGEHVNDAAALRSTCQALRVLIERITKVNQENSQLAHSALKHLEQMKTNVLGEAQRKAETYTDRGSKQTGNARESRLLSAEV